MRTIPLLCFLSFAADAIPQQSNETLLSATETAYPVPEYAQRTNQLYQARLRDMGSIFANDQLDGVQLGFSDPTLLANSNIESAFQQQSSCITCHALASISARGAYFNIVNKSGGNNRLLHRQSACHDRLHQAGFCMVAEDGVEGKELPAPGEMTNEHTLVPAHLF
jgi:hypothetical protein